MEVTTCLILSLLHGALLQLVLDLPDEGGADSLLELVGGCVQVEYLDDLGDAQLVAHLADPRHVLLALPRLQQLRGLDDRQQGVDDLGPVVLQVLVARPLLQLGHVVSDLHAAGPVAHVLPQQQVVEAARAQVVEDLPEYLADNLRIEAVLL